ncbi:unnamed protein product [Cunninghamella blakesleeana]
MAQFRIEKVAHTELVAFDEKKYFSVYPSYEVYNEKKTYKSELMQDDGYGMKKHIAVLYTIMDKDNMKNALKYVIYQDELSEEEQDELKNYCTCSICTKQPDHDACSCCIGCLHTEFYSQHFVNEARKLKYGY